MCSPTIDCIKERLASQYCPAQGLFEPIVCPAGFYCPNFTTMIPCPEDTYCLRGSTAPLDCPPMSVCPPQTEIRRFYGGVVVSLIFDILLAAFYFFLRFFYEPTLWAERKKKRLRMLGLDDDHSGKPATALIEMREKGARVAGMVGGRIRSLLGGSPDKDGYADLREGLSGGLGGAMASSLDPSSGAPYSPKAVVEEGFTRCNAGLHMDLEFEDLRLTLPPPISKTILSDVSGRIRPGRVTAIMGPSGAGKTTFLSVLMGKVSRTGGVLKINGKEDEMYRYKKIVGFVPQDDTMMRELTVRENILFSARVRLPRHGWTDAQIQTYVEAVIEVLGLGECADTLSENVSGGQRKRTNIGMELAMAPTAIFLDEPTSGLDSTAALEVCRTLRSIADLGLTVVAVIHQPRYEIFETFDDLLILAPGGHTVYMGPQSLVLPYFGDVGFTFHPGHNPADDLLDFVAGKGSADQMDGFYSRVDAANGGSGGSVGGFGSPPSTPSKPGLPHTQSYASMSSEENGTTPETPNTAARTKKTANLLAQMWQTRGAAHIARLRTAASANRAAALRDSLNDGLGGVLLSSPPRVGGVSGQGSLQGGLAVEGSGHHHEEDEEATRPHFDPLAMTADRGASFMWQVYLCHNRSMVQQYRQATSYLLEMGVGMLAGGMMGAAASQVPELYMGVLKPPYTLISPSPIETLLPSIGLYVSLAVGLAGSPAGVRTFGEERAVYYREASSGHSKGAYYIAKTLSMFYRFTSGAFHFAAVFHMLANPTTSFTMMFIIVVCQYFAVYGLAAITSMVVKRENSALLGVIVSLVAGCLCGFGPSITQLRGWHMSWIQDISYARWSSEAWFHYETLPYRDMYMVEEVSAALFGYTLDRLGYDIAMILIIGTVYRIIAFALLVLLNREKQR